VSWVKTDLEVYVESQLKQKFGSDKGEAHFANFVSSRTKVLDEIGQIQGVEPLLSDHGPKHIADVMKQVLMLISTDEQIHKLQALDLYVLLLAVLFHDVGNLFGRFGHNNRIAAVYDFARGTSADVRHEKALVIRAARAHTGQSTTGDKNTLFELNDREHLNGEIIKLQTIAAVLRFADELAEGPQRTTDFFRNSIGYGESQIYHQYASCTHVAVDRAHGRICLTYEIELKEYRAANGTIDRPRLIELLECIQHRIGKLDQERRYTRYYCELLSIFKKTEVRISFWSNGFPVALDIAFDLDDLVVPGTNGDAKETVTRKFGTTETLANKLDECLLSMEKSHVE
jgi:hypothetical protein